MIIAAQITFAIAALLLGQLFVLRRKDQPVTPVLRFAPDFDAPANRVFTAATGGSPVQTVVVAAGTSESTPVAAAAAPISATSEPTLGARDLTADHEPSTLDATAPIDANVAIEGAALDEKEAVSLSHEVAAAKKSSAIRFPWWRVFRGRSTATAVNAVDISHPVDEQHDVEPADALAPTPAAHEDAPALDIGADRVAADIEPIVAVDDVDDGDLSLSDTFGISDERRAEIAAEIAARPSRSDAGEEAEPAAAETTLVEPSPAPAVAEQPEVHAPAAASSPAEPPMTAAEALAEATRRASAWACDITGSAIPLTVDKRSALLDFYATNLDDPETRAIVERIEREDPDLRSRASAILRGQAA